MREYFKVSAMAYKRYHFLPIKFRIKVILECWKIAVFRHSIFSIVTYHRFRQKLSAKSRKIWPTFLVVLGRVILVKNPRIFSESSLTLIYISIRSLLKKVVFMVLDVVGGWVTTFSIQLQTSNFTEFFDKFIKLKPKK